MAIDDLPLPVVNFLNAIGVPWPYLNEDTIAEFAGLVRQFQSAVERTHADATEAVAAITRAHQSVSTEVMQSGWTSLTARHVSELTAGCEVLAAALDVAAGYIVAQKAEAIGVLEFVPWHIGTVMERMCVPRAPRQRAAVAARRTGAS